MLEPELRRFGLAAALAAVAASSVAASFEDDQETKKWEELAVRLSPFPKLPECVPIYVSAATTNRFCVDPVSLSVDRDGVVRYVLVVETPSGARNISYEGMRCEAKERRLYAIGQADGTWAKSRVDQWERIRDAAVNRQYAALFLDYFCPGGVIARNTEEARDALRRGEHPSVRGY